MNNIQLGGVVNKQQQLYSVGVASSGLIYKTSSQ